MFFQKISCNAKRVGFASSYCIWKSSAIRRGLKNEPFLAATVWTRALHASWLRWRAKHKGAGRVFTRMGRLCLQENMRSSLFFCICFARKMFLLLVTPKLLGWCFFSCTGRMLFWEISSHHTKYTVWKLAFCTLSVLFCFLSWLNKSRHVFGFGFQETFLSDMRIQTFSFYGFEK